MEQTLGSVFDKHIGFPASARAAVSSEAFVERLTCTPAEFGASGDGLVEWVDHFFEREHSFDARKVEFSAFAEGRERPVLELELDDQEYVVLESEETDDIIVVSSAGSMVVSHSAALAARLKAAELPREQQHRPTDAFKGTGERVYHVNAAGVVSALDAKAVLAALRAVPARVEASVQVAGAERRLSAFAPAAVKASSDERQALDARRPAGTAQSERSFATRQMQEFARRDAAGAGAAVVRVVDSSGVVREVSKASTRAWQHLVTLATDGGRRREGERLGAHAIALGEQTYAVKAGGVTALVQHPTQGLTQRAAGASELASETAERHLHATPAWVQGLLNERRPNTFWVVPEARDDATAPAWLGQVRRQAKRAAERARLEAKGTLGVEADASLSAAGRSFQPTAELESQSWKPRNSQINGAFLTAAFAAHDFELASPGATETTTTVASESGHVRESVTSRGSASTTEPGVSPERRATRTQAIANVDDEVVPRYRLSAREPARYFGPAAFAGALPATTLRTLLTSIEHVAAREGRRVRFADVELDISGGGDLLARQGEAPTVARLALETVPAELPTGPATLSSLERSDDGGYALRNARQTQSAPLRQAPEGALLAGLPFASTAGLRVGPELDEAIARVLTRPDAFAPMTVPARLDTQVQVTGGPGRIRLELPELREVKAFRTADLSAEHSTTGLELSMAETPEWTRTPEPQRTRLPRRRSAAVAGTGLLGGFLGAPGSALADDGSERAFTVGREAHESAWGGGEGAGWPSEAPSGLGMMSTPMGFEREASAIGQAPYGESYFSGADGDAARPLYVEPALATASLPLAQVNERRAPGGWDSFEDGGLQDAAFVQAPSDEADTLDFEIPLPLHSRMSIATVPVYARRSADGPIGMSAIGAASYDSRTRYAASARQDAFVDANSSQTLVAKSDSPATAKMSLEDSRRTPKASARPQSIENGQVVAVQKTKALEPAAGERSAISDSSSSSRASSVGSRGAAEQGSSSPVAKAMPPIRRKPALDEGLDAPSQVLVSAPESAREGSLGRADSTRSWPSEGRRSDAVRRNEERRSWPAEDGRGVSSSQSAMKNPAQRASSPASADEAADGRLSSSAHNQPTLATRDSATVSVRPNRTHSSSIYEGASSAWFPSELVTGSASDDFGALQPRLRKRGATPLRFSFPASTRWWGAGAQARSGRAAGYAGALAVTGAERAAVVQPQAPTAALPGAEGDARTYVRSPDSVESKSTNSVQGVTPEYVQSSAVEGRSAPMRVRATRPSSPRHASAGERLSDADTAYVVLGADGNARVMGAKGASEVTQARGRGAPVDMAVVTAIPPQAPTLEQMSVPGHDRPHAKSKNEGTKASGTPKTDSMALQGTVDSLAQRIYHRLRRRLDADRERFGG